jgi:hypothetical protein
MKERPILFSAPMVRAILEGRKTVTRRVLKPYRKYPIVNLAEAEPALHYSGRHNDPDSWGYEFLDDGAPASLSACPELCPYGQPGDRLWVRETWGQLYPHLCDDEPVFWRADYSDKELREQLLPKWRPSIHMYRWASRITLEVTDVRVERLHGITDAGCEAEGVRPSIDGNARDWPSDETGWRRTFRQLWDQINGEGAWHADPWVWVVEFQRIQQAYAEAVAA